MTKHIEQLIVDYGKACVKAYESRNPAFSFEPNKIMMRDMTEASKNKRLASVDLARAIDSYVKDVIKLTIRETRKFDALDEHVKNREYFKDVDCPVCDGEGSIEWGIECEECKGSGTDWEASYR